ncbi:hypothetical protein J1N36_27465, partial [Pseudomonas monteilii]|uniref:hypothetical protein n=2 Tax=Pseudomonas monteilii TaxID=76759 RepID=UPI001CBC40AA
MPQTRDAVVAVVDADPDDSKNGWYYWDSASSTWKYFIKQPSHDARLKDTDSGQPAFAVQDPLGNTILEGGAEGLRSRVFTATQKLESPEVLVGDTVIEETVVPGVHFVDESGFVGLSLDTAGGLHGGGQSESGSNAEEVSRAERNAGNLAASSAVRGEFNSTVQRPVFNYNHILTISQSLGTGYEGWPALSRIARYGNLMFGDSPRPGSAYAADFTPLGGATLKPLVAVVQSGDGRTILTDEQVAALTPGAGNEGESPDVGAVNFARKMFLQYHGLASDPDRLFVLSNCGFAGTTIEQLSKGATPDRYQRFLQAAQGVKAIADSEGKSYGIPAFLFMQGEYNYTSDHGGDNTKDGYKAKLLAQANNWRADIAAGIAGQDSPPAIITYQTSGSWTRDGNNLAIGMAQWELSQEQPDWFMATPSYPFTDKGGHLDCNGYRWMGAQLGKVLHRVVTLGENWIPLSPRRVTITGRQVLIDFHVPCPPLVFAKPYVVLEPVDYANKGFRVVDAQGSVGLTSVEIVSETQVVLTLARSVGSDPLVQYATLAGSSGNGNLRDSDPTVSADLYTFEAGTGQYPGANIADLVNKPYPLHNWCIAFSVAPEQI